VPFVLPWDDASPGVADVSGWLTKPAGALGPIQVGPGGHLYAGRQRVRFLGVNVCVAACFPRKEDADKLAARMAKFGINVVRFHHMDMEVAPDGLRSRSGPGTGELDAGSLDRLDHFISRLKKQGIYSNINLLVSRPFSKGDGLPAEIEQVGWKERHVAGFFYEPMLKLQKDYARKLLTHHNPYTGLTYAEDPAVAFVEVNNENGLIHAWLGRQVDELPAVFRDDLRRQWNAWLRKRYGSTARLRQAWGVKEEKLGAEMLVNGDFARSTERWRLERHEGAEAAAAGILESPEPPVRIRSVRIVVTKPGKAGWHVQFNQSGIKVEAGRPYTLTFRAKANRPLRMSAELKQAHDPWQNLGLQNEVTLGKEWQSFRFVFLATKGDDNARVNFGNLGGQAANVWLADVSLRPGGVFGLAAGESLEDGSVGLFRQTLFGERTPEGQRDWLRFLWETEDAYWQAMRRFLKEDLKVRGVVVGTIVGCSTPNLMAKFDAVDSHAYWQHPEFPRRPWDAEDWTVRNRSMVNEAGGVLPGLALRRVRGKPHLVSEYNHPAPNTFGSEAFLLLAAYGALQDWDAIYAFAYSHRRDWDVRRIPGFFDIDQHPTRMVTLPAAAALFVRGDVKPAREEVVAGLDREREVDALRTARAWSLVHAGHAGIPPEAALVHRVAIAAGDGSRPRPVVDVRPAEGRYVSDTGELVWDLGRKGRGVVTVNTVRSKAVIGYGGGRRFKLGELIIEPGETVQDGWSAVTLTAMAGGLAGGPARVLVTATGYAENAGMKWKSADKDSVGRNWGEAPSLVESVPVRLTLPCPEGRVRAWALDERGQRRTAVPVRSEGGQAVLDLGPRGRTLWYEVEIK
jgi:hypothetical protein